MAQSPAASPLIPDATPTQRAYTLRLRRSPGACSACGGDKCTCWRDALWATHEAVNKGAKVFGDWLLTLRGGLSHELVDRNVIEGKGEKKSERSPTDAERRDRRILLALSWLSVESSPCDDDPARQPVIAACGAGSQEHALRTALRDILQQRNVQKSEIGDPKVEPENQPDTWLGQCGPSLAARIREDAVWVNRSAMFDAKACDLKGLDREYAHNTIMSFFGPEEDYFKLPDTGGDEVAGPGGAADEGPEFRTLARRWASTNFGTGEKSDIAQTIAALRKLAKADFCQSAQRSRDDLIAAMSKEVAGKTPDFDGLRIAVGWKTGRPSKGRLAIDNLPVRPTKAAIETMQQKFQEEADAKASPTGLRQVPKWMAALRESIELPCGMPFKIGEERDHIGEFSVMLDHAARRVSIAHSWIKRAEAERRRFEADAQRLSKVPTDAATWLDAYVQERSGSAGGEYRIRRRAVEGWEEVLKRWRRGTCKSAEDRIAAAREVQADPEIDKFGDIQLFEALASDDALCVWRNGNGVAPDRLKDYVFAHDARFKQRRFKVPAYRHPDALRHPVFGDFGNSRWDIEYAVHEAAKAADKKRAPNTDRAAWLQNKHGLRMGLWDGNTVRDVPLRWSSKRLTKDLALNARDGKHPTQDVGRADRLGRAASGVREGETPSTTALFGLDDWNGRLQAPRGQLDAIAKRVEKRGWDDVAKKMLDRLEWLVTFSAKLECRGPFIDYAKGFDDDASAKPFVSRKGELAVKHATNDKRQGHAKLILSRLPGLRILSVDLGHRFAAACAVWEAISPSALKKEIAGREVVAGGTEPNHLFCHTRHIDRHCKQRTTIYRRIGSDKLPDGSDHPAPWARLDRQFLIKLQGEERPARAATNGKLKDGSSTETNEVAMVAKMASDLGQRQNDADGPTDRGVDELMRRAVRIATLGLKRHGRIAKIAYAFKPDCPGIPGMGGSLRAITRGDDDHVKFLTNALADWHALATDTEWDGSAARQLWNEHVKPLHAGFEVDEPTPPDPNAERPTRQQRSKSEEDLRNRLKPIAEHFAKTNAESTREIHDAWTKLWTEHDGTERNKNDFAHTLIRDEDGKVIGSRTAPKEGKENPGGWHERLRVLTDWVMGWHLSDAQSKSWNRNVGGLSLTRITTMRALYQLHKSFAMRPRPDKVQGAPERGESNVGVAQSILDAMDRMREQRIKQIASRVVEAALGVGIERDRVWDDEKKKWRYPKRPRGLLYHEDGEGNAHGDPRFKPCHAVVIENLRNYRPDELQTRRENRALMSWSAGKVRKYLEEACQLHGLHLREVMPNYTSRQCSRTGLPGVRCVDVSVDSTTGEPKAFWWKKALAAAKKKVGNGNQDKKKGDAESQFIVALAEHLGRLEAKSEQLPKTVRVPRKGGDLFIAAPPWSCRSDGHRPCPLCDGGRAVQADLNAAANIGLRALLDPDFPGKWWYVPCVSTTGKPARDKCGGAACLDLDTTLLVPQRTEKREQSGEKSKTREKTNAWRDVGATDGYRVHAAYWNDVQDRVVTKLTVHAGFDKPKQEEPVAGGL